MTEALRIWCGFLVVTVLGTSGTCGDEPNPREGRQEGRPVCAIVPLPQSLLRRQGEGRQQPWDWRSAGFVLQQSTPAMASSSSGMTRRSGVCFIQFCLNLKLLERKGPPLSVVVDVTPAMNFTVKAWERSICSIRIKCGGVGNLDMKGKGLLGFRVWRLGLRSCEVVLKYDWLRTEF